MSRNEGSATASRLGKCVWQLSRDRLRLDSWTYATTMCDVCAEFHDLLLLCKSGLIIIFKISLPFLSLIARRPLKGAPVDPSPGIARGYERSGNMVVRGVDNGSCTRENGRVVFVDLRILFSSRVVCIVEFDNFAGPSRIFGRFGVFLCLPLIFRQRERAGWREGKQWWSIDLES